MKDLSVARPHLRPPGSVSHVKRPNGVQMLDAGFLTLVYGRAGGAGRASGAVTKVVTIIMMIAPTSVDSHPGHG